MARWLRNQPRKKKPQTATKTGGAGSVGGGHVALGIVGPEWWIRKLKVPSIEEA